MDTNRFSSTLAAGEEYKKEVIDQINRLITEIKKMIDSIEKTGYDSFVVPYIEDAARQDINYSPAVNEDITIDKLNIFISQLEEHLQNLQESYTVENAFDLGDSVAAAETFMNELLDLFKDYKDVNQESFNDALEKKRELEKVLEEIYERIRSINQEGLEILETADTIFRNPSYRRKQFSRGHSKELRSEMADNAITRELLDSQINTLYLESFPIKRQLKGASFSPQKYNPDVFTVIDLAAINPKYSNNKLI